MRSIRCLLGHKPYVDESGVKVVTDPDELDAIAETLRAGAERDSMRELSGRLRRGDKHLRAVFGPTRRYCGRCGETLPGIVPEVGDRMPGVETRQWPGSG